jgi:TRAP-type C4-dicarboxylate transport system permease large subunit
MFMESLFIFILKSRLLPVAMKFKNDPIHVGDILVLTNEAFLHTPPLRINHYVASKIVGVS